MKIFLGSSREQRDIMHKIATWLSRRGHTPIPWDDQKAFRAGDFTLFRLLELSKQVEAAILVFSEDDQVWYRDTSVSQPRDNVILEYGIFSSRVGPKRAIICRVENPKPPSDLLGLTLMEYSEAIKSRFYRSLETWLESMILHTQDIAMPEVECLRSREELYAAAACAAAQGTKSRPVRHVKIYAPLGFGAIDTAKENWLKTLRDLVVARRVTDVEALYGLPSQTAGLAKAANFITYFFSHTPTLDEEAAEVLFRHTSVRGVPLGGPGLGIPRGFGVLIVDDRVLLVAYSISRGEQEVQQALAIRSQQAIRDMSDWFDHHAYLGSSIQVLQEHSEDRTKRFRLVDSMRPMLRLAGLDDSKVDIILGPRLITFKEISELGIDTRL